MREYYLYSEDEDDFSHSSLRGSVIFSENTRESDDDFSDDDLSDDDLSDEDSSDNYFSDEDFID